MNGLMKIASRKCMGRSAQMIKGPAILGGSRSLNVHEYVSMDIMREYQVPVPKGFMATGAAEAQTLYAKEIGQSIPVVVKAMVLAGGRGKGAFLGSGLSGVNFCSSTGELADLTSKMIGYNLVTKQTTAAGLPCSKIMVVEKVAVKREMYISIMLDRSAGGPIFIASPAGGTSIEDVAEATPELIFKQPINIIEGITDAQSTFLATSLGFAPGSAQHAECKTVVSKLYQVFTEKECTLLEVNPLVETASGQVMVCDAKLGFDDNAEFRQRGVFMHRDRTQEDPREVEAAKYDLNYIGLTGNIGCMVNGAGLAMATMDIIKLNGGDPANFLDVGGGATSQQVEKAFELLNADPNVKVILVNIFGGIMRCDVIATGILEALNVLNVTKPIVVRMRGTNATEAKKLLDESPHQTTVTDCLAKASSLSVAMAQAIAITEKGGQIKYNRQYSVQDTIISSSSFFFYSFHRHTLTIIEFTTKRPNSSYSQKMFD